MSWPGQPPSSQGPPNPGQIPQSQLYAPPPLAPIASIHPNVNLQRPLQPQPYYPYPLPRPEGERQPEQHDSKRMRISRACDGCRRKKIRCYTTAPGQPCKNCMSSKIDCTYNDNAKKRGPPKGYIEVLENRLKRMERILSGLADNDDDGKTKDKHDTLREFTPSENERQQPIASTSSSSSSNNNNNNDNNNGTKLSSLPERNEESSSSAAAKTEQSKKEERPQRVSGFSSLSSSTMTRYVGDMSPLPFLAQKINFEDARVSNHIGFKVRKFGQSLVLVKENDTENGDASVQLLQKLGMLKPDETINSMNEWILRVAGIDRATSDRLMKIYFAYIHPGLPILNKVLFLKQYRRELGDYPSPALLNAIYGAAARYIETCALFGDKALPDDKKIEPMKGWSENLFENLLLYVRGPYSPCIATIQALVIGQYHRASLDERFASNWMLNSAATRMAQDLGLHRSSASWDIPDSEKETRRRVWWSVYIMDKWSSAGTGRPQTIFDEDCDESYPSESATWEEVMDAPYDSTQDPESEVQPRFPSLDKELAKKAKGEKIPLYQPFVQLVKLSEILGRILQGLYTPRAKRHSAQHGSDAIVSYLDKSLSEWRSNLPPSLQISSTNVRRLDHRGHMPLLSMSGLMYLAYCTLLILLHRPFIENDQELHRNKLSSSSLTICTNAATRCIDIAEKMHYRDFLLVSWNFALYPIFTAALIHIYNAASSDSIVSDVAKTNLVRSMAVIRRITKLSPAAGNLYEVLKKLVAHRGISVEDLMDGEDTADSLKKPVRKRKQRSTQAKNRVEERNTSTSNAATRTSSLSPKVSDVRGGPQPETTSRRGTTASSTSDADRASASGGSTPTSVMNGDWLNGFYSGLEQQESAPATNLVNASAQDMSDPYSLQQFGLPMGSMFPSVEQLQTVAGPQPQQQQQQQQPQTVGSMLLRLQSTDDFLFGFPDVGLSMDGTQQPSYSPSQPVVASDTPMASSLQGTTAAAPTSSAPSMYMQSNDMSQTQFRYRPDNPFWSVPSTLELDDWTAYLLPQQQQQQQQQQRTGSEPPRQQQQMSWNGWM